MNIYPFFIMLILVLLTACSSNLGDSAKHNENIHNPLPECPGSPNCVRTSVPLQHSPDQALASAKRALEEMKATTIDVDGLAIDAVCTIPVFGWKDDVNIKISADSSTSGSILHIRSASREGYWDLGVNARRVKKLISKTEEYLTQ